jgi:hypothetical protein
MENASCCPQDQLPKSVKDVYRDVMLGYIIEENAHLWMLYLSDTA